MRSKRIIPGFAVFAVTAALGLSVPVASAQNEGVVARVGDTEITESDLAVAETMFASQTADMSPEARRSLLVDNLIDLELIVQAAAAEGLRDDPAYRQPRRLMLAFTRSTGILSPWTAIGSRVF